MPVTSVRQLQCVEEITSTARQAGVHVAAGGARLNRNGYIMTPTNLVEVDPSSRAMQEEILAL